jgi:hypothetical protein
VVALAAVVAAAEVAAAVVAALAAVVPAAVVAAAEVAAAEVVLAAVVAAAVVAGAVVAVLSPQAARMAPVARVPVTERKWRRLIRFMKYSFASGLYNERTNKQTAVPPLSR